VPATYDSQMQQQAYVLEKVTNGALKQDFIFFVEYRPPKLSGGPLFSVQLVPRDVHWYETNKALIVPFLERLRGALSK